MEPEGNGRQGEVGYYLEALGEKKVTGKPGTPSSWHLAPGLWEVAMPPWAVTRSGPLGT